MITSAAFMLATQVFAATVPAQQMLSAPDFLSIKSDKAAYTIGERAILLAEIKIHPSNPDYEIYIESSYGGQAIKTVRISRDFAVAVTPVFAAAGSSDWVVDAYFQDKSLAADLNATIAFYESERCALEKFLAAETDPVRRGMLQAQIDRDAAIVSDARVQLAANRRKVETQTLAVPVGGSVPQPPAPPVPGTAPLIIEKDGQGCGYHVGDHATFFVHVMSAFEGPDGPEESIVTGRIGAVVLSGAQSSAREFTFTSAAFTAQDMGERTFEATLYIRSKARASSLRDAIAKAATRRAQYIALRDETEDPLSKAYYQREIDDLTDVLSVFHERLESMKTLVGTRTLGFCVGI